MIKLNKDNLYRVIVVGCGGTGSHFIPFLMQLYNNNNINNILEVILIDGDVYETKNTQNQKCLPQEASMNKAQATVERFNIIYPNLKLKYIDDYITDKKQLDKYIEGPTILISCVDNNASRKLFSNLFNEYIGYSDLIYIDSGNGTVTRNGQVVIGYRSENKTHLKCVGDIYEEVTKDKDDISEVGTCMRISQDHPQNIATNVLAATTIFTIVTNILMFRKIESNIVFFNADTHNMVAR